MFASENATQRGSTAAAFSKVLAYNLLRWDEASLVKNLTGGIDYQTCRGMLDTGQGIGRSCIAAFAPKDAFTRHQIDSALGILKDSGRMADIIAEARAKADVELRAEQEAAERALAEAKRKEEAAKTRREREAAAKETKKAEREAAKRKKSTEAHCVTLPPQCRGTSTGC